MHLLVNIYLNLLSLNSPFGLVACFVFKFVLALRNKILIQLHKLYYNKFYGIVKII